MRLLSSIPSEQIHNIFIQNLTDPTGAGGVTRGIFHNGGRSTLNPEEATTWSFGLDWRPQGALQGLSASATYYRVDYSGPYRRRARRQRSQALASTRPTS